MEAARPAKYRGCHRRWQLHAWSAGHGGRYSSPESKIARDRTRQGQSVGAAQLHTRCQRHRVAQLDAGKDGGAEHASRRPGKVQRDAEIARLVARLPHEHAAVSSRAQKRALQPDHALGNDRLDAERPLGNVNCTNPAIGGLVCVHADYSGAASTQASEAASLHQPDGKVTLSRALTSTKGAKLRRVREALESRMVLLSLSTPPTESLSSTLAARTHAQN